jgi:hypothetical protein
MADAQRWRSSPEFQKLKPLQQQSSTTLKVLRLKGAVIRSSSLVAAPLR